MGEQYKLTESPNNVILEGRRKVSVSGVTDMESFDEAEVVLGTTAGTLVLRGSELHVEKLSLDSGDVIVTGIIDVMEYEDVPESSGGFFSRLFG